MKNSIIGTVLLTSLLAANTAFAGPRDDASVKDFYKTVTTQIPHTQNICNTVDVPIYGTVGGGASGADVLGGMIIGGLLGKGVTGKDDGAAAGAVLGGIFSADKKQGKQQIVGYRQEQRCNRQTTYTTETNEVYSHSIVTFYHDGRRQQVRFNRH